MDSGAFVSIFSLNEAAGLGLDSLKDKETFVTVGDGGLIPVYVHRLRVQIGSIAFNPTRVEFPAACGGVVHLLRLVSRHGSE